MSRRNPAPREHRITHHASRITHHASRITLAFLLAFLLYALFFGYWRGTSANPQVQVPMFYDAHYVFPRPWTQAQAAPGVPNEAAVSALYGPNRVSQPFTVGTAVLTLLELELMGEGRVEVSLADADGRVWGGTLELSNPTSPRTYRLRVPPTRRAKRFRLTLTAPEATAAEPVTLFAVGGDRLGGALFLNEYRRPGNLALRTYVQGDFWGALGEQLLPVLFRLRLQQYTPAAFKGHIFVILLVSVGVLSLLTLFLAQPGWLNRTARRWGGGALVWFGVLAIGGFLGWQLAAGRLLLAPRAIELMPRSEALSIAPEPGSHDARLVHDLALTLWTAAREPDERFVDTFAHTGRGAIGVPLNSEIRYSLIIPPAARLRVGLQATLYTTRMQIQLGDEVIHEQVVRTGRLHPVELDLSPWAGQARDLSLTTAAVGDIVAGNDEIVTYWLQPQIETGAPWLAAFPPPIERDGLAFTFEPLHTAGRAPTAGRVELLGRQLDRPRYSPGDTAELTLQWHAAAPTDAYPTLFIHVLDADGQIVAQRDAQPVRGAYPVANWQPNAVVVDVHPLPLPADLPPGDYQIAVGFYNPDDLARWTARTAAGDPLPDNRVLLDSVIRVSQP